jgi:ribosome-associated toxin RatA of RatAB toxin-antitoxin module
MQKLIRSADVEREAEAVFELLADPARYPEFFVGITRWERCSEKERGLGSEFRVLMRVGSIEAGGTVHVTDWQEPLTIAWRSERGVEQHGRWTVTPHEDGSSEVTLEIAYDLAGGLIGRLVELIVARVVGGNMAATMLALRRVLEFEDGSGADRSVPHRDQVGPSARLP